MAADCTRLWPMMRLQLGMVGLVRGRWPDWKFESGRLLDGAMPDKCVSEWHEPAGVDLIHALVYNYMYRPNMGIYIEILYVNEWLYCEGN